VIVLAYYILAKVKTLIVIDLEAVHTIFQRTISYSKIKPVSERAFNILTKSPYVKLLFDIMGAFPRIIQVSDTFSTIPVQV
jgi:hypothetical protein